jgi:site-specific DNA-methyltransferase (adenine-specific)
MDKQPISQVFNCDCLEYMKTVSDKYFSLSLVDPPYGIGMDGGNVGYKGFNNLEKKQWDNKPPPFEYFKELFRISDNQIIWGGNYFIDNLYATRCFLIWDKGEGFYNRTYAECEMAWTSLDGNAKIYKHDPLAKGSYKGKINPCQKPIALYKWILYNYAKEGDKIFDSHMGSQSSRIAAYDMGFDYWGTEIDTDYFKDGCKRFDIYKSQLKLF